ncbi:hypothetical protein MM213_01195 [Belliella sp. R4-6]|uniref:CBU-0592-like domain-containing protein n=1 Tax=Belliella alkalica TaxID=1730871 RepID=A0ABS9V6N9_9BACT|nr:hypothetical protein [Belliella alkalica]MCH7412082.1 hypothetical protein [Belliella alkalica]
MKFWMDSFGWLGALCFLVSYFLLITKKWESTSYKYHISNILGAVFLVLNTLHDASFPSVFINACWGAIAVYGMMVDRKKKLDV